MTNSINKNMCFFKLTSTSSTTSTSRCRSISSSISGVLLLLLLCAVNVNVNAFNLDTLDYVQYRGDKDSMFGFSVAAHKYRDYNWVLIGAPQANSSQPGVYNGGAVYYCPTDRDEGCRLLNFDRSGNNNSSSGHQIDEKSGQWFGATVQSGGPDKPIVACAPRYLWYTLKSGRRDPVGTCYVSSSDFRDFSEFSPCRTRHWGYHRQGTCQAGLGAAISKDGERLFIGAPGSWYWQGQMYSIDPDAKLPFTPPRYSNYGTSAGQVYSQDLRKRPSVLFTKEGQPLDDDSYLGYSVTSGNFTGEKEAGIAAGMPRGSRLVGKVLLYTWNLTNYKNISGSQLGAYFGYSLAAADVNGDGLDDLIVGAPLHTEPNNEKKYELGRIYVIYPVRRENDPNANPNSKWPRLRFDTIDGVVSKGRFGLSVTSLGDLDLDGYQDIAVGAPYSGPHGRGAVYIYYGSKKGIRTKVSQVIYAEDASHSHAPPMNTFGFSVSGSGIDLDNNYYPDLVIGAYRSDTAFIFRAQPVINVDANITFNTPNGVIGLDEKNCSIAQDRRVVCTSFEACVNYNGIGVNNQISLIMEFTLDAKKTKDPRMFSYHPDRRQKFNETWILRRNDLQCKNIQVYIRENTRDKLTPMEVQMKYHLYKEQSASSSLTHVRNPRSTLQAVLNGNSPSVHKDSINIRKNCGSDDVCIPDLRLHVKSNVDKYLLGSGKKLELDVIVKNEGEDSFESMFYMKLPPGINYFNTVKLTGSLEVPVKCSPPSEFTNNTLKCDIGNPLPKDKLVHFKVMLDPFNIEGMSPSYDFTMFVNSTNKENTATLSDNAESLTIDIWVKTNLSLTGWAQSPDIHYKENQYKESNYSIETEIGPNVVHIYSLKNNGPSDIIEAEVLFIYPSHTLGGDDLLYIMEQPETSGSMVCEPVPQVNALKVEVLPKKYYLESSDSKTAAGRVGLEEKLTTNVASSSSVSGSGSGRHEVDDKSDDTGDASYIHANRGKERTSSASTGSSSTSYRSSSSSSSSNSSGGSVQGSSSSGGFIQGSGSSGESVYRSSSSSMHGSSSSGGSIHESSSSGRNIHETGNSGGFIQGSGNSGITIHESSSGGNIHGSGSSGSIHGSSSGGSSSSGNIHGSSSSGGGNMAVSGGHYSGSTSTNVDDRYFIGGGTGTGHSGERTWTTRNTTTTTTYTRNSDGSITKHTVTTTNNNEDAGGGGGASGASGGASNRNTQGHKYKIYYTSSGNGNSNSNSNGNSDNSHFGINQQENKEINYGTVQHTSHAQAPTTSFRHNEYFNWNKNNNTGSGTSGSATGFATGTSNVNAYGHSMESADNRGFIISTEESVNEGLDEYTRTVTHDRHNKLAIDGNEFRTGALDLGSLDFEKNNVESGGNNAHVQQSNVYYDPDLGSYEERTENRGHSVTYGGNSRPYNTGGHHSSSSFSSSSSSSSSRHIGDNVPTEHPVDIDYRNRIYRNKRRAIIDDDISDIIECKSTKCSIIRCKAGRLVKDEEAWSALRFRANAATLKKIGWTEIVTVSSMMVSRINKLPYIGTPNERPIHTHEVFTNMTFTEAEIKPDVVPLWVVVLSACAGAIILLLLIFLLYKCGFFKRNRPSDVPERQPLNRNGHYQGDEQL